MHERPQTVALVGGAAASFSTAGGEEDGRRHIRLDKDMIWTEMALDQRFGGLDFLVAFWLVSSRPDKP